MTTRETCLKCEILLSEIASKTKLKKLLGSHENFEVLGCHYQDSIIVIDVE